MRTRFKVVTALTTIIAAFILVVSCQKEQSEHPKPHQQTEKKGTIHCSPWRTVTGWSALISEVNGFSNCITSICEGNSTTTQLTNYFLQNSNGATYFFNSNQVITTSEQSDVMNAASTWATAHKPAGYSVSQITYSPQIVTAPSGSDAAITIVVTYRKCLGGGGGGES